ncbi:hypothetical protein F4781DRAFT_445635 [Annulohypoxylon bovei var. microspora]|nr:hypothetical protein F4781DRAFT_445635 [Annulohypoxylon bovei var. microspora]
MKLYCIKVEIGTDVSMRDIQELLVDGLTLYGIKFVYKKDYTHRTPLRPTHTTVNLDEFESVQNSAENEMVHRALTEKPTCAKSNWYGFDLLIRLAVHLLETSNINAAERAFLLAKTTFDTATDMNELNVTSFIENTFDYTERRFAIDNDDQRVRDILGWAESRICKEVEDGVMEDHEDWWESQTTRLLGLIETPIQRAKRRHSKIVQKVSNRFSSLVSFKHSDSRSRPSLRRGLRSVHGIAASPAGPATSEMHNDPTVGTSKL